MEFLNNVLEKYDMKAAQTELLRHNENRTYKVSYDGQEYVLRIHKPVDTMNVTFLRGDMAQKELTQGEMLLLECLAQAGMPGTQIPVRNRDGEYVTDIDGTYATLISWVPGECVAKAEFTPEKASQLGEMLAVMHNSLKDCRTLTRYAYDEGLIEKMQNRLVEIKKKDAFICEQSETIDALLKRLHKFLQSEKKHMLMVHNDLGESNFIYNNNRFVPIDFSLSGLCVREMDLASLYCHFEQKGLRQAIYEAYNANAYIKVDREKIDLCMGFQLLIFLFSQYENICGAPWFKDMVEYWCEAIFESILAGREVQDRIGLYS